MRSAWLEIDLAAYRANLAALRAHCGAGVLAVVKANAYGHGLVPLARAALAAGAEALGVALPEEGAALREAGDPALAAARIVVLGPALPEQATMVCDYRLEPVIASAEMVAAFALAACERALRLPVHLKVDTGMGRLGVEPDRAPALCQRIAAEPHLALAGVCTHFARADESEEATRAQWQRFLPVVEWVRAHAATSVRLHAANSAAALWFPLSALDWIRPGLATYGVNPGERPPPVPLRPVLALKARIALVREFPAGAAIGYGGTYVTPAPARLAIVPLGYADGVPWSLGNRGTLLVRGQPVPIRGRVCMDQILIDVTNLPGVAPGEEAVVIGRQGSATLSVEAVAATAGTIPYELLTRMAERLPRRYRDDAASA